jgi:hypothetical protein
MIFVHNRKHTCGPSRPVTGIELLLLVEIGWRGVDWFGWLRILTRRELL